MRGRSARMDDPFRNTFVVEVENLLAQHEIFEQRRAARPGLESVLIVRNTNALIGREVAFTRNGDPTLECADAFRRLRPPPCRNCRLSPYAPPIYVLL